VAVKRENIIRDEFEKGEFRVLFNCMVLTEGTDIPCVDCIMIARPTRNISLMIQIIGRGLRLFDGKTVAKIVTFMPINAKKIITGWNVLAKIKKEQKNSLGITAPQIEQLYDEDLELGIEIDPDKVEIVSVDLFDKSKYSWFDHAYLSVCGVNGGKDRWGPYRLGVAVLINHVEAKRKLKCKQWEYHFMDENPRWAIIKFMSRKSGGGRYDVVGVADSMENAVMRANVLIAKAIGNGKAISDRDNGWHKEALSNLTASKLERRGLPTNFVNTGMASRAIYWFDCHSIIFGSDFLKRG